MNNCVGFPNGVVPNTYIIQTGTGTSSTSTVAKLGLIEIYLNSNDMLYFTNSEGNACNIQIPPNALYTGATLVTAMNNLFATSLTENNFNILVAFSAVTNLFILLFQIIQQQIHLCY